MLLQHVRCTFVVCCTFTVVTYDVCCGMDMYLAHSSAFEDHVGNTSDEQEHVKDFYYCQFLLRFNNLALQMSQKQ